MNKVNLYKQSFFDFESALKSIKDSVDMNKPFETIFRTIVPMMPKSWLWTILMLLGDAVGFGPGRIGEFIDKLLGFGSGARPELSDEKLEGAATTVVNTLIKKYKDMFGSAAEAMVKDIYFVKKSIDVEDLVAIGLYIKNNNIKVARKGTMLDLSQFFKKSGRGGLTDLKNILFWVLRKFAGGLIGLGLVGGVVGGVKKMVGKPGAPEGGGIESLFPKTREPEELQMRPGSTDLYLNVKNDVEDTLIHFLDSAYKLRSPSAPGYMKFSEMFAELNGYPLKGSNEMREILGSIDALNWGELSQIDSKRTFVGPILDTIAKRLIPVMKFEEGATEDKKELLQALRGIYK